jgi:hypothetical protein
LGCLASAQEQHAAGPQIPVTFCARYISFICEPLQTVMGWWYPAAPKFAPGAAVAKLYTPGPSWRFELLLGVCTILLIGVAIVVALW